VFVTSASAHDSRPDISAVCAKVSDSSFKPYSLGWNTYNSTNSKIKAKTFYLNEAILLEELQGRREAKSLADRYEYAEKEDISLRQAEIRGGALAYIESYSLNDGASYAEQTIERMASFSEVFRDERSDPYSKYSKMIGPFSTVSCLSQGASLRPCMKAAARMFQLMKPRIAGLSDGKNTGHYSLPELTHEVLTDSKYAAPVLKVAKGVLRQIESYEVYGKAEDAFLFEDLVISFKESGASDAQAKEMTWNVLAVLSSNFAMLSRYWERSDTDYPSLIDYVSKENAPVLFALSTIVNGMFYLDGLKFSATGKFYSLPPEVETECQFSRTYHFWMSGYLYRKIRSEGYSRNQALGAGLAMTELYNFFAPTYGRGIEKLLSEKFQSPYQQSVQISYAFEAAGMLYAAGETQIHPDFAISHAMGVAKESVLPTWIPRPSVDGSIVKSVAFGPYYYGTVKKVLGLQDFEFERMSTGTK
jgi:hypothetical protein